MEMKTSYAAVNNFACGIRDEYKNILEKSGALLDACERMGSEASSAESRVSGQQSRARSIAAQAKDKADYYEQLMEAAYEKVEKYEAEIEYIYSHPRTVTYTDSEGNTYQTTEIDQAALSAAQSNLSRAQIEYQHYKDLYDAANEVYKEANALQSDLETLHRAISMVDQLIRNNVFELKKYQSSFADEANYNIGSLIGVMDVIGSYLASKDFKLTTGFSLTPTEAHKSSFVPSGGGSTSRIDINVPTLKAEQSKADTQDGEFKSDIHVKTPKTVSVVGASVEKDKADDKSEKAAKKYPYKFCREQICVECTQQDRDVAEKYAETIFDRFFAENSQDEKMLDRVYGDLAGICDNLFAVKERLNKRMMCAIRVYLMQIIVERTKIKLTETKLRKLLAGR